MRRSSPLMLAPTALLAACDLLGIGGGIERTLEIAPYKAPCYALFPTLCLQARQLGETKFLNLYDTPGGFDFRWGLTYVIEVEEHEVSPVPEDGSSIRRELKRIVSETPVAAGSVFTMELREPEALTPLGGDRYALYFGPEEIVCSLGATCAELADAVGREARISLVLAYPEGVEPVLPVVAWVECGEEGCPG